MCHAKIVVRVLTHSALPFTPLYVLLTIDFSLLLTIDAYELYNVLIVKTLHSAMHMIDIY